MSRELPAFAALFSDRQEQLILPAPMFWGQRHPPLIIGYRWIGQQHGRPRFDFFKLQVSVFGITFRAPDRSGT